MVLLPAARLITPTIAGLFLFLAGCQGTAGVPDAIPDLRAKSAATSALIETAREGIKSAKAIADAKISPWLDAIDLLMGAAGKSSSATESAVEAERVQKSAAISENASLKKENADLKASWGHQLQIWCTRFFWLLVGLLAAHVVLSALGLFIPGAFGAGLSIAGRVVNPAGWVSTIADNLFFRGKVPASP